MKIVKLGVTMCFLIIFLSVCVCVCVMIHTALVCMSSIHSFPAVCVKANRYI